MKVKTLDRIDDAANSKRTLKFEYLDGRPGVTSPKTKPVEYEPITADDINDRIGQNRDKVFQFNKDLRAIQVALKKDGHLFNSKTGTEMDTELVTTVNGAINVRCSPFSKHWIVFIKFAIHRQCAKTWLLCGRYRSTTSSRPILKE